MKASGGGGEGAYLSGGEGGDDAKAGSVSVTYKGVSSHPSPPRSYQKSGEQGLGCMRFVRVPCLGTRVERSASLLYNFPLHNIILERLTET